MKKTVFVFILLLVLACAAWFGHTRGGKTSPAQDGRPRVVTSGYVPYSVARQIGGDKINLSMLLPANAEPHSFEPTPGAIVAVNAADVFIYVSPRIEPWVKDVAAGAKPGALIVEAAALAKPSRDPHVWMDFDNMRPFARAAADAFSAKDPANKDFYEANLQSFNRELDELDADYSRVLKDCRTRRVVHVGHLAFGNLTERYGLEFTALSGTSHDGEHSVKRLAGVVKLIKESGAEYVFTEEELSQNLAATVARETGAKLLPLYTVEHVGKQDADANVTYARFMRRNLNNLARGLSCRA